MIYQDLMNREIRRYSGNPVITNTNAWHNHMVAEPCIIPNPLNPSELIMFFMGAQSFGNVIADETATMSIGRATASADNPFAWNEHSSPVFTKAITGWDSANIRLNNIWAEGTVLYMSYTGTMTQPGYDSIGIATSYDNGFTWARSPNNPIMTPTTGEVSTSQGFVLLENGIYYLYFSYRVATGNLIQGIKVATASSPDGPYTRVTEVISSWYYEWHQVVKLDDGYMLVYEAPLNMNTSPWEWGIHTAFSIDPTGPFFPTGPNLLFDKTGALTSSWDSAQTATGAIYFLNNKWLLFYQGGENITDYGYSYWQMGIAEIIIPVPVSHAVINYAGESIAVFNNAGQPINIIYS